MAGVLVGASGSGKGGSRPAVDDERTLPASGETRTVLSDGRWLLLGGRGGEGQASVWNPTTGLETLLTRGLRWPRSGHSATVLPDGRVLVFGGLDANGEIVKAVEFFDPETESFSENGDVPQDLTPRAFHTATLLVDGRVLLAGGISGHGDVAGSMELWDVRSQAVTRFGEDLGSPRYGHSATVLPNGVVLLAHGFGFDGRPLDSVEIVDLESRHILTGAFVLPIDTGAPELDAAVPADGATDVAVESIIGLRFSKPLAVSAVRDDTVVFTDAGGRVPANIIAAEGGKLIFVTPQRALQPATAYTLNLVGLVDEDGVGLPATTLGFMTGGTSAREAKPDRRATGSPAADTAELIEEWNPDAGNLWGGWRTGRPDSPWRSLPPLQAARGVTALAGQVLGLNGHPLPKVRLSVDAATAETDETGRFLLLRMNPGRSELLIDGGRKHGTFEVGVEIVAGQTTVLSYTIWLPQIDLAHALTIPSPTTEEIVVTTPRIPGLEIRIPPNTVIRDHNGEVVTRVSITPIPLDRPPFPLPQNVRVPVYFTVQPGGAYVMNYGDGGVRFIYPNYGAELPGTRFKFWHYDPEERGWYVYGKGTVMSPGEHVVPDPGVAVYEFTGSMLAIPEFAPDEAPPDCLQDGDPVNLASGLFVLRQTDLFLPDVIPISLTRTYRQNDNRVRAFGVGGTHPYDIFLVGDTTAYLYAELILPDGRRIRFNRISPGTSPYDAVFAHASTPTRFYGARMLWNWDDVAWNVILRDGTVYIFPDGSSADGPPEAALLGIRDRYGNRLTLDRDFSTKNLLQITSPNGRWIKLTYVGSRITKATDNAGRQVIYTYAPDGSNRLVEVQDANGGIARYTYDGVSDRLKTISDARRSAICPAPPASCAEPFSLTIDYWLNDPTDGDGTVKRETLADGSSTYEFSYQMGAGMCQGGTTPGVGCTTDANCNGGGVCVRKSTQTTVTNPRGYTRVVTFNVDGYALTDTQGSGARTITYARQPGTQFVTEIAEPLADMPCRSRKTLFGYDPSGNGNLIFLTRKSGPCAGPFSTLAQTTYTYERFDQVATITNALTTPNRTTHYNYDPADPLARLTGVTDPTGRESAIQINAAGQLISVAEPLLPPTTYAYDGADLIATTDPLQKTTKRFVDAAGRVRSVSAPLGRVTRYDYDNVGHVTRVTDPLNGAIDFHYDPNGNLEQVKDSRHSPPAYTNYHYNALNQMDGRSDPMNREESFFYDPLGNLVTHTDRLIPAVTTDFRYDPLNRRTCAGFGRSGGTGDCENPGDYQTGAVHYAYDKADDQVVQLVDIANGTVTRQVDDLGNLLSESGSLGTLVLYTYEPGSGRRTSMSIGGQTYGYCYDDADRLTKIVQGTDCMASPPLVVIMADPSGRRKTVTLLASPNGVETTYGYDSASRISSIQYRKANGTMLGGLTYTYDAAGNRIHVAGEWARTGLPPAVSSNIYGPDDRLGRWGTTNFTYDRNGNLLDDGTRNYTWNARNQLTDIAGAMAATFVYDPLGRRSVKTIGGVSTGFVYDGLNPIQELSSTTPASLVTGLGIDEYFLRTTGSGTSSTRRSLLTDGLGSTVALTTDSGDLQTQYTYEPFGQTSLVAGSQGDSDPFQFTGRENDAVCVGGPTPGVSCTTNAECGSGGTCEGLYYYRARSYSPTWGRFIGEDPLGLRAGVNLYTYVGDSPTNRTDPSGLVVKAVGGGFTYAPPYSGPVNAGPSGSLTFAWDHLGNYGLVLCGGTYVGWGGGFIGGLDVQRSPQSTTLCDFTSGDSSAQTTVGYADGPGGSGSFPISEGAGVEVVAGGGWGYFGGGITTTACRLIWSPRPLKCDCRPDE